MVALLDKLESSSLIERVFATAAKTSMCAATHAKCRAGWASKSWRSPAAPRASFRFGDSVTAIAQGAAGVDVTLAPGPERTG